MFYNLSRPPLSASGSIPFSCKVRGITARRVRFLLPLQNPKQSRVCRKLFVHCRQNTFHARREQFFFTVGKAKGVYFCFEFKLVLLYRLCYFDFFALVSIGGRFDMCRIDENGGGVYISRFFCLRQDTLFYPLSRL